MAEAIIYTLGIIVGFVGGYLVRPYLSKLLDELEEDYPNQKP